MVTAIVGVLIFLYFTVGKKIPNVVVPDVSGMTVVDAEQVLQDAGFVVNTETIKVSDESYKEGEVVKTEPAKGRSIKQGKSITIYESIGKSTYVVEDYTGKNYIEIQTLLKNVYKLDVKVEKKEVESTDDLDDQAIIDQSIKSGTEVKAGDKIILYIPDIYDEDNNPIEVANHPEQIVKFKLDTKVYKDNIMRVKIS